MCLWQRWCQSLCRLAPFESVRFGTAPDVPRALPMPPMSVSFGAGFVRTRTNRGPLAGTRTSERPIRTNAKGCLVPELRDTGGERHVRPGNSRCKRLPLRRRDAECDSSGIYRQSRAANRRRTRDQGGVSEPEGPVSVAVFGEEQVDDDLGRQPVLLALDEGRQRPKRRCLLASSSGATQELCISSTSSARDRRSRFRQDRSTPFS
jgi:hypothetical protein